MPAQQLQGRPPPDLSGTCHGERVSVAGRSRLPGDGVALAKGVDHPADTFLVASPGAGRRGLSNLQKAGHGATVL
jgi:hypothetical protein